MPPSLRNHSIEASRAASFAANLATPDLDQLPRSRCPVWKCRRKQRDAIVDGPDAREHDRTAIRKAEPGRPVRRKGSGQCQATRQLDLVDPEFEAADRVEIIARLAVAEREYVGAGPAVEMIRALA